MSVGFKVLFITIFGLTLIMGMTDILVTNKMIEDNFSTVRTANINALTLIENEEEITDLEMLNNWLLCFIEDNNMSFNELKINFMSIGSDPPHYVVYIEGSNNYALISNEVHSAFKNSAAIVESAADKN